MSCAGSSVLDRSLPGTAGKVARTRTRHSNDDNNNDNDNKNEDTTNNDNDNNTNDSVTISLLAPCSGSLPWNPLTAATSACIREQEHETTLHY